LVYLLICVCVCGLRAVRLLIFCSAVFPTHPHCISFSITRDLACLGVGDAICPTRWFGYWKWKGKGYIETIAMCSFVGKSSFLRISSRKKASELGSDWWGLHFWEKTHVGRRL
jgi:hypothetical protein